MDDDLNLAYANTGVIHVIAISGMHLGLIYGLLLTVFRPTRKTVTGRVFSNLLIMGFLWMFTLVCGASASVTRSALMFSSLLVAESFGQENTAANALASSAFIMLCCHPMVLYDIGFQLSYAAVASLMLFNMRVRRIFDPENPLLVQVWHLVATSCAAQILTTPLVLQHFGRFPVLFIPANLVAIPLSGLILVLLILVCISHPVDFVAGPLASCIGSLMDIMNERILDIARIPFASLSLDWSTRDTVFAYITIAIIWWFVMAKRNPEA
jgi:competence protein ComEC